MAKKIRNDGQYSGVRRGGCGCGWPMILKGAEEIARYLRVHYSTAYKWLERGRIPARKDGQGRWLTSRTILDRWIEACAILRKSRNLERQ